jgi:hypothetical protein
MTETDSSRTAGPLIVVLGVQQGVPPFRIVQISGQMAGIAHSLFDVLEIAHRNGLVELDLDDPAVVNWVGGDKFTWTPRSGLL